MAKFIGHLNSAHLSSINVYLYENDDGTAVAKVERLGGSKVFGSKVFESVEAAREWKRGLPGNELVRMDNAIKAIAPHVNTGF